MEITKEILKFHKLCASGYIMVLEKYGNNFKVTYEQALKDFPEHTDWIRSNLYQYKEKLVSSYKGKFGLNQIIYRQKYVIGDYIKSRIERIELNLDNTEFSFTVTAEEGMENNFNSDVVYNFISERRCFETLEDLKAHWHVKIEEIK